MGKEVAEPTRKRLTEGVREKFWRRIEKERWRKASQLGLEALQEGLKALGSNALKEDICHFTHLAFTVHTACRLARNVTAMEEAGLWLRRDALPLVLRHSGLDGDERARISYVATALCCTSARALMTHPSGPLRIGYRVSADGLSYALYSHSKALMVKHTSPEDAFASAYASALLSRSRHNQNAAVLQLVLTGFDIRYIGYYAVCLSSQLVGSDLKRIALAKDDVPLASVIQALGYTAYHGDPVGYAVIFRCHEDALLSSPYYQPCANGVKVAYTRLLSRIYYTSSVATTPLFVEKRYRRRLRKLSSCWQAILGKAPKTILPSKITDQLEPLIRFLAPTIGSSDLTSSNSALRPVFPGAAIVETIRTVSRAAGCREPPGLEALVLLDKSGRPKNSPDGS
ncbi:hypothetical protein GMRT_15895 [Giardia muris]|uniref:Uncharacterized protein n=1 Tax=Giardia muris TaxID=5742 RepID=A0A4Z1SW03_GIAMU|nr:hypothetical protein GMRT_15895 [Giardia muris]|eukprot:TNJ29944.1 hypothetical protein GMRT_15895 [Giardia muris]